MDGRKELKNALTDLAKSVEITLRRLEPGFDAALKAACPTHVAVSYCNLVKDIQPRVPKPKRKPK